MEPRRYSGKKAVLFLAIFFVLFALFGLLGTYYLGEAMGARMRAAPTR
jgi:hypothetical protein